MLNTPKASRRGPSNKEVIESVVAGYSPSDGCPPLNTHWGGIDLAQTPWLKKFAEEIARNRSCTEAWAELKVKCDTSYITDLIYAFTFPGELPEDKGRDLFRTLKEEIDGILPAYDKLGDEIRGIINNSEFSPIMAYHRAEFSEQVQLLRAAHEHLNTLRGLAAKWGSHKRAARSWYLLLLLSETLRATGSRQESALMELIQAGYIASQDETTILTEEVFASRVKRELQFLNGRVVNDRVLFRFGETVSQGASSASTANSEIDDSDIPF